jgi:ketosteroid isomerase-like protein
MPLDEYSKNLQVLTVCGFVRAPTKRNHKGESPSMLLNAHTAREILDATHAAFSKGDIAGMSSWFVDDMTYWSNTGSQDGSPLVIHGRAAHLAMVQSIASVAESVSVTEHFQFSHGIGRAQVEAYIRHRQTGHVLSGTFRQIVTYRGNKILRLDEYHDAAKMAAFWRLVTSEVSAVASHLELP